MNSEVKAPVLEQRRYYTETAARYDTMHAHEAVDDDAGLRILLSLLRTLEVRSLLDVGSATGRGLPRLSEGLPDALICGVEPVEAIIENWWRQGMMGGAKAHYDGIVAFSQTDFTEDLKKITVPVLVMHSEDDQIVPYVAAGPLSAKLLKNGTLKTYKDFPHGMITTQAETINADLLAFLKQ